MSIGPESELHALDYATDPHLPAPIRPLYRRIALVHALFGIVLVLGFDIVLVLNGQGLMDLWGSGRVRTLATGVGPFIRPAVYISTIVIVSTLLGFFSVSCLAVVARRHQDRNALRTAGLGALVHLVAGYLALRMGFVLAGI